MLELNEKSEKYAAGKATAVIEKAIAQAYADGYRDGYKDREEEIPVNLRDNKIEYVDLGLPSGTLWSADYESGGGEFYFPYDKAAKYEIPSNEQCLELYNNCQFTFNDGKIICIGLNGNYISFDLIGYKKVNKESSLSETSLYYFWIDEIDSNNVAAMWTYNGVCHDTRHVFKGYKLPIRLVRKQ